MVEAYILVQTEVGKAADVASLIGKMSGVTQRRTLPAPTTSSCVPRRRMSTSSAVCRREHRVGTRDHPDAHLPRGAHLSSSAASGVLCGPSPRAAASCRSDGASTSRRSPGTPSRPSSAAPPGRAGSARPAERGPERRPGDPVYSVVPSPAASATNAVGQAAAARSARPICSGRSAGRSADSAAVPRGASSAAYPAPCRSAALSPAAAVPHHQRA